jgi:hypothetical protein
VISLDWSTARRRNAIGKWQRGAVVCHSYHTRQIDLQPAARSSATTRSNHRDVLGDVAVARAQV